MKAKEDRASTLFDRYKLAVEMADCISGRRGAAGITR